MRIVGFHVAVCWFMYLDCGFAQAWCLLISHVVQKFQPRAPTLSQSFIAIGEVLWGPEIGPFS